MNWLTVTKYPFLRWQWLFSLSHNFFSHLLYHQQYFYRTWQYELHGGCRKRNPSRAPVFTLVVPVLLIFLVFCVVFLCCLSLFGIVCLILPLYLEFVPCFEWLDSCCSYCLVMSYCVVCVCLCIMVPTTFCPILYLSFVFGSCFSPLIAGGMLFVFVCV